MHKRWKCPTCGHRYISPIRITGVICQRCSTKVGTKSEKWMKPDDD